MTQRGFLIGPFIPYLVGLLAVIAVLTGVYWKGRVAGVEAAESRLQPLLTACEGRVKALGSQIDTQNAAVEALAAAGKARQARASAGIAAARSDAQKAQTEAARLREAMLAPVVDGCPAAQAVRKVREGLR